MRNRRTSPAAAVAAAAALGVALTVVGATVLRDAEAPTSITESPASEPTVLGEELIGLDRGTLTEAEALRACSSRRFAAAGPVEVLYGVRQLAADGEGPVVVLHNAAGELRLCDDAGATGPSQSPVPHPSDDEPVVPIAGRAAWECTGKRLDRHTTTTWFKVAEQVATVRQRLWVDGDPGPWFTTAAVNGFVHLSAWQDGPLPRGTELGVQYEVLDADGGGVAQTTLPTEPEELTECQGGDVAIA